MTHTKHGAIAKQPNGLVGIQIEPAFTLAPYAHARTGEANAELGGREARLGAHVHERRVHHDIPF